MKGIFTLELRMNVVRTMMLSLLLAGCTKDPTLEEIGIKLRFINASPNAGAVQFKLNDQNAYTPALAYGDTTTYLLFTGGTYNLVLSAGSQNIINTIVDFTPRTNYSIFVVDSLKKLQFSAVKDDLALPATPDSAKVRFFNLSPNSTPLRLLKVLGTDTTLISGARNFNDFNNSAAQAQFSLVRAGVYDLLLYSGSTFITKLAAQPIVTGKIYTIYAKGFYNIAVTPRASLAIMRNN